MTTKYLPMACLLGAVLAPSVAFAEGRSDPEDGPRIVCKAQAKTGTRFAKKICRTTAQWEAIREEARRNLSEMQSNSINACRDSPSNCH